MAASEFDFEKMIKRLTGFISARTEERRQKQTFNVDSAIPQTLIGDKGRLSLVIMNLFSNAVKFTRPEGSIHLEARL